MVVLEALTGESWEDVPLWQKEQLRSNPEVTLAGYIADMAEAFAALRARVEELEETNKKLQRRVKALEGRS
jgi:phage shock protein A